MKAAALLLLLTCLVALLVSRASWTLLDGAWERLAIFALGWLMGLVTWTGVAWFVVDYLARKERLL